METTLTLQQPLVLRKLPNYYPVWMNSLKSVAHAQDDTGFRTICGKPIDVSSGHWVTVVQVAVWLKHAYCPDCFSHGHP